MQHLSGAVPVPGLERFTCRTHSLVHVPDLAHQRSKGLVWRMLQALFSGKTSTPHLLYALQVGLLHDTQRQLRNRARPVRCIDALQVHRKEVCAALCYWL